MQLIDIMLAPQSTSEMPDSLYNPNMQYHESCFRSWNLLTLVEDLLRRDTPSDVVLELIKAIRDGGQELKDQGYKHRYDSQEDKI